MRCVRFLTLPILMRRDSSRAICEQVRMNDEDIRKEYIQQVTCRDSRPHAPLRLCLWPHAPLRLCYVSHR